MPTVVKANDPSVAASVLTKQTIIISADPTTGEIERTTPEAIAAVTSLFAELTTNAWGGDNRYKTLTANTALTLSGTNNGGILHIYQDSVGGRTLTINGTVADINTAPNSLTGIGSYRANGEYFFVEDKTVKKAGAVSGGGGNTNPAAPTIIADDTANTIDATHALGDSEILISINNGAYAQFDGNVINVGDVARDAGYYKFKTKAATGRNESPVASSPAFNVAGGGGSYPSTTLAYWKFEETSGNFLDSTANGKHLTRVNGVTTGAGKIGNGAHFSSASNQHLLGSGTGLSAVGGQLSIEGQFKVVDSGPLYHVMLQKGGNGGDFEYNLYWDKAAGNLVFQISQDGGIGGTPQRSVSQPFSAGTLHHVVAIVDGTTIKLSVNNNAFTTNSITGIHTGTAPIYLGSNAPGTDAFDGSMDIVKIHGAVLSDAARTASYNGGAGLQD